MNEYVSTEFSSVTLRYHPSGYGFGSPYTWTCRVSAHPKERGTAVIAAFQGAIKSEVRCHMGNVLKYLGFENVQFSIKGRWHTYPIARWSE